MTILVTGATGFVGSHVTEQLARAGRNVRALVRRTSDTTFLKSLPNVELVEGAVDDAPSVERAVQGTTAVIHAAGLVKARNAEEFRRTNTQGTENVVDAARKAGVARFVYVSSLTAAGPSEDGVPISVDRASAPVTDYGRSKLAAEQALVRVKDQLRSVILRPAAIYGPRDREILIFFKSIANGVLPLTNPLKSKLSMIYGADCASACIRAIDADVPSAKIYALDDGNVYTFEDLILMSEAALGRRAWLRIPLPQKVVKGAAFASELYGRVTNRAMMFTRDKCNELFEQWVCDGSDARRDLDWKAIVPFAEGAQKTVDWYREHRWI